jgi:hypothetical protein
LITALSTHAVMASGTRISSPVMKYLRIRFSKKGGRRAP